LLTPSSDTAAEILHESTGLTIKRNAKNKFIVVTLHHTADPHKRGEQWRAEARAGMKPGAFEKEYDLDYTALFGEKVFPQINLRRDKIVVQPPYPVFPESQVYFAGLDHGKRNPAAFEVFTVHDGVLYCVWELYEPAPDINLFARKMLGCPYYDKIKFIAADPHIGNFVSHDAGVSVTILYHYRNAGIKKIVLGDASQKGASAWVAAVHEHWESPDPTFRIFSCVPNLIREFGVALYTSQSDRQLLNANYAEGMVDHNNHAMDATKYLMLAKPKKLPVKQVTLPTMADRWS
jgi:hypothetical protein